MSLLVWAPLDTDLRNQGVSSIAFSYNGSGNAIGSTTGGKVSTNCYQRTASAADCIKSSAPLLLEGDITLMCWYKNTNTASSGFGGIFSYHNHSTNGGLGINIYYSSGSDYRMTLSEGHNTGRTYQEYKGNTNIFSGWHHLCLTYKRSTKALNMYVDGVKDRNTVTVDIKAASSTIDFFCWSTGYDTNTTYRTKCQLQDARVYDECLSQAEIKEIAQGLMLHYPMNKPDGYLIGRNLIKPALVSGGQTSVNGDYSVKTLGGNADTYFRFDLYNEIELNTDYTFSCDIELLTGVPSNNWYMGIINQSGTYQVPMVPGHHEVTIQFTTQPSGKRVLCDDRGTRIADGESIVPTFIFKNVKLEKGSKATIFIPSPESNTLFSAPATIADNSSCGNRGTLTNITGSTDCKLGSGSYKFNGSSSYILTPNSLPTDEFTLATWVKFNNISETQYLVSCRNNVGTGISVFLIGGKFRFDTNNTNDQWMTNFTPSVNTWYHIVFTKNASYKKLYVNGVYKEQLTSTTAIANLGTHTSIGASQTNGSGYGNYLNGLLNDYKLFSVALNADDIKQLYEAHFHFYPNGNMGCTEYIEGSATQKFNKTGIFNTLEIKESPSVETIVEDDGAVFAKILHHNNVNGTKLFTSTDDFTTWLYKDDDRWAAFNLLNGEWVGDEYEILIVQYPETTSTTPQRFRFVQYVNPMTAAFADVDPADITSTTLDGYTAIGSNYGGLYLKKSSTYLCANNSNSGNWWGAIGSWATHGGGIPGYNSQVVKGLTEVYVRIHHGDILRLYKNGATCAKHFKEI